MSHSSSVHNFLLLVIISTRVSRFTWQWRMNGSERKMTDPVNSVRMRLRNDSTSSSWVLESLISSHDSGFSSDNCWPLALPGMEEELCSVPSATTDLLDSLVPEDIEERLELLKREGTHSSEGHLLANLMKLLELQNQTSGEAAREGGCPAVLEVSSLPSLLARARGTGIESFLEQDIPLSFPGQHLQVKVVPGPPQSPRGEKDTVVWDVQSSARLVSSQLDALVKERKGIHNPGTVSSGQLKLGKLLKDVREEHQRIRGLGRRLELKVGLSRTRGLRESLSKWEAMIQDVSSLMRQRVAGGNTLASELVRMAAMIRRIRTMLWAFSLITSS